MNPSLGLALIQNIALSKIYVPQEMCGREWKTVSSDWPVSVCNALDLYKAISVREFPVEWTEDFVTTVQV